MDGANPTSADEGAAKRVTVVVTPRERFGPALRALDTLLEVTSAPYELIYVSGRLPRRLAEQVDLRARTHGFRHERRDRHLAPNEARNIGAGLARTPYVVFIDNDVFPKAGWLTALLAGADDSRAEVVAPLTCQGWPLHTEIHQAGGTFATDVERFFAAAPGQRQIEEEMFHQGERLEEGSLERHETQLCEFHCVLVRREALEAIGGLDEDLLATKEHLDFCMTIIRAGGRVVLEPSSVVTYLIPNRHNPLKVADWPYFLLRWSPAWQWRSLERFQRKWGLADDGYMRRRASMLGWRHDEGVGKRIARKIPIVRRSARAVGVAQSVLRPALRAASRAAVAVDDAQRALRT